jgi:hypothetical protein
MRNGGLVLGKLLISASSAAWTGTDGLSRHHRLFLRTSVVVCKRNRRLVGRWDAAPHLVDAVIVHGTSGRFGNTGASRDLPSIEVLQVRVPSRDGYPSPWLSGICRLGVCASYFPPDKLMLSRAR